MISDSPSLQHDEFLPATLGIIFGIFSLLERKAPVDAMWQRNLNHCGRFQGTVLPNSNRSAITQPPALAKLPSRSQQREVRNVVIHSKQTGQAGAEGLNGPIRLSQPHVISLDEDPGVPLSELPEVFQTQVGTVESVTEEAAEVSRLLAELSSVAVIGPELADADRVPRAVQQIPVSRDPPSEVIRSSHRPHHRFLAPPFH